MAKVVIAGRANCPYFAKVELIGDRLKKNLPDFNLHKIVKTEDEWEPWLGETCTEKGWSHGKSPLVWRELVDRGGKGVLIGGANEFQEYVMGYYGIQSDMTSNDMTKIAEENKVTKVDVDEEEKEYKAQSCPLTICITNASSPVCYNVINMIASGNVFGSSTEIDIRLLDIEDTAEYLSGVTMETHDLAYDLLRNVSVFSDATQAFKDCSVVLFLDELEAKEEETTEERFKRYGELFTNYAKTLNEVAAKNVKVLVAGLGPLNFNTHILLKNAPDIPKKNIIAMSRMVENHAKSVVGNRLSVNPSGVVDLIIWGNINNSSFIDVTKTRVHGYDGAIWGPPSFSVSAREMIHDDKWLMKEFLELVAARRSTVETALNHSAAMSQANAIATTLNHWTNGSPSGQIFSMAVCSEGWYNVPEGVVFSFPVTMTPKGDLCIVQDIELSDETVSTLKDIVQELEKELEAMYPPPCKTPEQTEEPEEAAETKPEAEAETNTQEQQEQQATGEEQNMAEDNKPEDENKPEDDNKTEDEKAAEGDAENSQDVKDEEAPEGEQTT